jgi:hypothetical protein
MPRRHVAAIAGAVASVVAGAALAGAINFGILRTATSLKGPGRLGATAISPVGQATNVADAATSGQAEVSRAVRAGVEEERADD